MDEEEARRTLTIDVERVVAAKSPRLARLMPGCLFAWLKRTVHQDDMNDYIVRSRNLRGIEFAADIVRKFEATYIVRGGEHLAASRRFVVASNHPLGGLDGMALLAAVGEVWGDIKFPVNDLLLHIRNFSDVFVPVNKVGANGREAVRQFDAAFAGPSQVLMFPAGLCSRLQQGVVRDLEWKKSFVAKAVETRRDIIPCHISGANSMFFYRLARVRKALGLKFNVEMLYLPDEMYRQQGKTLTLTFGAPIGWESLRGRDPRAVAGEVRELVYRLAAQ